MVDRPLTPPDFRLRRPTEADHVRLVRLVPEWWGEKRPALPRLWLRQFAGTSRVVETAEGRLIGVGIGFASQDEATRGVILLVAVGAGQRRHGLGTAVAREIEGALGERGATTIEALVWPGNRIGVRFLEALGYAPLPETLATRLFGVPAIADYDGEGEDRSVFVRELPRSSTI